jgi:RNA polymerase sigma-70 factor (ECF subfamily)
VWDRVDNPGAWVRRVVSNRAVSRWRRRTRELAALTRLAARAEPVVLEPADDAFWDAVRALPHRQAQVVALYYLEDLSVVAIAGVLGIAGGTVKATLAKARQRLATQLGCTLDEESP